MGSLGQVVLMYTKIKKCMAEEMGIWKNGQSEQ